MFINSKYMKTIITECKRSVGKETSVPVAQNIHFMKMDNKTLVWTSDFETAVAHVIDEQIENSFTVKLKDFEKYTKNFNGDFSIQIDDDNNLTIEDEKKSYKIEELIDFDEVPFLNAYVINEILNPTWLLKDIDKELKYCNRVSCKQKPAFDGVFFSGNRIFSTDGFSVLVCKTETHLDEEYFVNKTFMKLINSKKDILLNLFNREKEQDGFVYKSQWAIAYTNGFAYIDVEHASFNHPAIDAVIPTKFKHVEKLDIEEVIEGVEGAFLKENSVVVFRVNGIDWKHEDNRNSSTNTYHYKMNFPFLEEEEHVALDGNYVLNGLKNTDKYWNIKFNKKDMPVLFETTDGKMQFIIMPMHMNP